MRYGIHSGRKSRKPKMGWIDKFVIFVFGFACTHWVVEEIRLFLMPEATEASALTAGVFGICTGELIMLLILHRLKINRGDQP